MSEIKPIRSEQDYNEALREIETLWGGGEMKKISSLHRKWMKQPEYRREYEALEGEFALASAMI